MAALAATAIALTSSVGLALQLWILLAASTDWLATVGNFFGYFTILTNGIVAIVTTAFAVRRVASPLTTPNVLTAVAVYITTVGVVYVAILEPLWNPQGAQLMADVLLHKAVPVIYALFWVFVVPASTVRMRDVPRWLLYPIAFLAYALARGAIVDWYPYFFIDPRTLGYGVVALNSAGLVVGFFVLSTLVVAIGRAKPVPAMTRAP